MINKICETCGNSFSVLRSRAVSAKYCSTQCRDIGLTKKPNQICTACGKEFHRKQSQIDRYNRTLGIFCSNTCSAEAKSKEYVGKSNPNYKGKNIDTDGYPMYTEQSSFLLGYKRMKLHQAVCCEQLGIQKIPKGFHVHHRDCDINNNTASNLVVMNPSDHKWLHKQYGIATLWAFCNNKNTLEDLVSWSDDKNRALLLLPLDVTKQSALNLIKDTI